MPAALATAMDGLELGEFLRRQRIGVLSLADGNVSYAIPVAYVYRDDPPRLFLRLGVAPDSQKRRFLKTSKVATFVVFRETAGGWQSVLVEGRLEELTRSTLDSSIVEKLIGIKVPSVGLRPRPVDETAHRIYRLDVTELTGLATP